MLEAPDRPRWTEPSPRWWRAAGLIGCTTVHLHSALLPHGECKVQLTSHRGNGWGQVLPFADSALGDFKVAACKT